MRKERIKAGEIPLLTQETLPIALESLLEDLTNWDCGHQIPLPEVVTKT